MNIYKKKPKARPYSPSAMAHTLSVECASLWIWINPLFTYQKKKIPIANIITNEKFEAFPLISVSKQGCSLSTLLLNIVREVIANITREEEETKSILLVKEEIKLSLLTDDMGIYAENTKELTRTHKQL